MIKLNKSKVYVVNRGHHDYSNALRFGELIFLSEGKLSPLSTGKMAREFEDILKFSSKNDFILVSSLTIMNMLASSIFSCIHDRLNLLIFHGGKYVSRTVVLNNKYDNKENES